MSRKITTEEAVATVVTAVVALEVLFKIILTNPKSLEILRVAGEAHRKQLDDDDGR